jgi:excinuclease ABC subunit A
MEKPDVDAIEGLSPAISIEQKTAGHNPRSTVGTVTEIYDYLRLLYARAGTPHCPNCGRAVQRQSAGRSPTSSSVARGHADRGARPARARRKGEFRDLFETRASRASCAPTSTASSSSWPTRRSSTAAQNHDISVVVDRLVVRAEDRGRLTDSLETALRSPRGWSRSCATRRPPHASLFRALRLPDCGISLPELEPRHFSFNSPFGACPACGGLGTKREVSEELILGDPSISILEGVVLPWGEPDGYLRKVILPGLAKQLGFDLNTPWGKLPPGARRAARGDAAAARHRRRRRRKASSKWEGILANVQRRYEETSSDACASSSRRTWSRRPATTCAGKRLKPESLAVTVHGRNIGEFTSSPSCTEALAFFESRPVRAPGQPGLDPDIAGPILKEVRERLRFLVDVGLDYLTLDRSAESLSGGEAQRIRLATQIGSRLVGVLYILDEPSIGLHQRDNARLLATLKQLRDLGNTVIVVEHDEETIREADHLIDLGPGAGKHGGR